MLPGVGLMAELTRTRALKAILDAERGTVPFIVIETDGKVIEVVSLRDREVTIGRSSHCDIMLEDEKVSRLHASIERVPGGWVVTDEGLARNGTRVNGRRLIGRRRMLDRDVIAMGASTLTFRSPSNETAANSTLVDHHLLNAIRMTPAQRRVLVELSRPCHDNAVAAPAANQVIAGELFLSVDTVKAHLKALFVQFEVGDLPNNAKRAKLVETVMSLGILTAADFETGT